MSLVATGPAGLVPAPLSAPTLRWGVMGPGWIAERFVDALHAGTTQEVLGVASRDLRRAQAFADQRGVPRAYGSYDDLVADPDIDVVYVATPHPSHHACALLAIAAGKHVLVEKPLALNVIQADEIAAAARGEQVFAMEAMWTFFLPKLFAIRAVVDQGLIGRPVTLIADHGEHFDAGHRIQRADLAGGPLLDLGTYPVALASAFLGPAETVLAIGDLTPQGVAGQISIAIAHRDGGQSALHTTILSNTPTTATIAGTAGTIDIDGPFFTPGGFTVRGSDGTLLGRYDEPRTGHAGLHFQAAEVARCVGLGQVESPVRPLAESRQVLDILDRIRARIGTVFPADHIASTQTESQENPS